MNYGFKDLKEATSRLELAVKRVDAEDVEIYVKLIKNIATQIKNDFWAEHVSEDAIAIKSNASKDETFKCINTVVFLYKPMYFNNVYESNEIEYYAKERTEELVESGGIDAHNDFWQQHEIIYGTVYGSVPLELLNKKQAEQLKRCGWKKTDVEVLEVLGNFGEAEVRKMAEKHFRHYIIVKEKETQLPLILRYTF